MTQFPNDDQKLVAFMRQNRPVPPPAADNLEAQLMELVERQPISSRRQHTPFIWAVPSAIAAGLLLTWGSYRLLNPSPNFNAAELETFLVNNWNGAISETSLASQTDTTETDWLLLADLHTDSSSVKP